MSATRRSRRRVCDSNSRVASSMRRRFSSAREMAHELSLFLAREQKSETIDSRVSYLYLDAQDPESITSSAAAVGGEIKRLHFLVNTVGMLHSKEHKPEKRLSDVSLANLQQSFAVNAVLAPLLAQAFSTLLRHKDPAVFASLSARVGSIEDNRLGGWYSYRTAKAAQNMLLRTLAREWSISHRNVSVVALHPGTVESDLSAPFITKGYRNRVLTPDESADALVHVVSDLRPGLSGAFFDWQGTEIAW